MNNEIEKLINKKIRKVVVMTTLIGLGIGITTGVIASNYMASDIAYTPKDSNWKVSNIADAISSIELSKVSTNYSLEEKVVGTWVDGKPLYQKTVHFGALPNATTKNVSIGSSNIDKIVYINGFSLSSSVAHVIPHVYDNTQNEDAIAINKMNGIWHISILTHSDRSSFDAYVTLQYTKTTDTASNS